MDDIIDYFCGTDTEGKMLLRNVSQCASCQRNNIDTLGETISTTTLVNTTNLQMCTSCRSVWYCSRDCQKAHRKTHKKYCDKEKTRIANYKTTIAVHHETIDDTDDDDDDDDDLFRIVPPTQDDCPICLVPLSPERVDGPSFRTTFKPCCSKDICRSCIDEYDRVRQEKFHEDRLRGMTPSQDAFCPLCKTLCAYTNAGWVEQLENRIAKKVVRAMEYGLRMWLTGSLPAGRKNPQRVFELCEQIIAIDPSNASGYEYLAILYGCGAGVEQDSSKEKHYTILAAKAGHSLVRFKLGNEELKNNGNVERAVKHWWIAATNGHNRALRTIALAYKLGLVSKEKHSSACTSYSQIYKRTWSEQRMRHQNMHG